MTRVNVTYVVKNEVDDQVDIDLDGDAIGIHEVADALRAEHPFDDIEVIDYTVEVEYDD